NPYSSARSSSRGELPNIKALAIHQKPSFLIVASLTQWLIWIISTLPTLNTLIRHVATILMIWCFYFHHGKKYTVVTMNAMRALTKQQPYPAHSKKPISDLGTPLS